jgi:uncharacterized protein YjbI with pentapeptide repeats
MGRILQIPVVKPRSTSCPQGLRRPSPDLISKARDETTSQVTRVALTFFSTAAFCLLALFTEDSALLGGGEKISVPLAGPVSFRGFMLLGPAILIVLRVYLQIYVEHGDRLDRLAQSLSIPRAPSLVPLQNPLIRLFSALIFYLLLPVAMLRFTWKAAVFPEAASALFGVAIAVITSHMLLSSRFSWQSRGLLSVGAAVIAGAIMFTLKLPPRPLVLDRAKLSGYALMGYDFREASLRYADLRGADLRQIDLTSANLVDANLNGANLKGVKLKRAFLFDATLIGANLSYAQMSGADLSRANLKDADLSGARLSKVDLYDADLSGANLSYADLNEADLSRANLSGANLSGANLKGAKLKGAALGGANLKSALNLTPEQVDLDDACGDEHPKLPEGFVLKPCPTN